MKRLVTFLTLLIWVYAVSAQPILRSETHSLKIAEDNPMSYCDYMEPGFSGANQIWDFTGLKFQQSFTGYLANTDFENANTRLTEFDNRFFFNIGRDINEQTGYSNADGKMVVKYDVPFVKMKFPFAYGDFFSGVFSGNSYYLGRQYGIINGTYAVEADAYGTLLLPGNTIYENTIRIRTEKKYSTKYSNSSDEVSVVTYRWYNATHRYPLLVLTEYTVKAGNHQTVNYQAAYNNNAVNFIMPVDEHSLLLYPNPASSLLYLQYNAVASGELSFTITDNSGRAMKTFVRNISEGGTRTMDLTSEINGLKPGVYFMNINTGNKVLIKSFTLIE